MVFVDAFHGGLLGDASVRSMVEDFLGGGTPSRDSPSQRGLRRAATLIAAAATAWRMPEFRPACLPLRVAGRRVIRYAMARDENS